MEIIIQPIEKNISNDILNFLSDSLSTEFNNVNVTIEDSIVGEKLEQVQNQNQSNTAGKIIEELVSEEEEEPKKE